MEIIYVPCESKTVQGKKHEIQKRYGKEWNIQARGKGNGNWLLTKKSDVLVNGISYRNFIKDYYGRDNVTEKLFNKFKEDIESGKIKL